MVAVNSVNQCPYCDRLHTKGLARLAGVSPDVGSTAPETYAVAFADSAMRGKAEPKALLALGAAEGEGRAASMRALATFLMWGSLTGNTVNAVKKRLVGLEPLSGMSIYELTFFVYYGPLFFLVYVVSLVLMQLPDEPPRLVLPADRLHALHAVARVDPPCRAARPTASGVTLYDERHSAFDTRRGGRLTRVAQRRCMRPRTVRIVWPRRMAMRPITPIAL